MEKYYIKNISELIPEEIDQCSVLRLMGVNGDSYFTWLLKQLKSNTINYSLENITCFLFSFNNVVQGWATITECIDEPSHISIFINESYRKQGIAKQLMINIINYIIENNGYNILGARPLSNSNDFFKKMGFRFKNRWYCEANALDVKEKLNILNKVA